MPALRSLLVIVVLGGCTPPPAQTPEPAEPLALQGLDVSHAMDPLALACPDDARPLGEREPDGVARWETAGAAVEAQDAEAGIVGFTAAYCLLEGHPRQADALYALGVALMTAGRYRAAYEAIFAAVENGSQWFDGFHSGRVDFLRALLTSAVQRSERGEAPFRLCGANDRPGCDEHERCARDYYRFNMRYCPRLEQMDRDCPGVCVAEDLMREPLD